MILRRIIVSLLLLIFVVFFCLLAVSLSRSGNMSGGMGVNSSFGEVQIKRMPAPDFSIELFDDSQIRLSDLKGKIVVLDFWSSWCSPCRKEAQVLSDIYLEYRDKGVEFIGISIWDRKKDALKHIDEFKVEYPSGPDSKGDILVDYGVTGIPEKIFIDQNGNKLKKFTGPATKDELRVILNELLGY